MSLGDLADVVVAKLQEMDDRTWTSPLYLLCTSGSWAVLDSPVSCQITVERKTAQGPTYVLNVRQRARRSRQDNVLRFQEANLALETMASVISDIENGAAAPRLRVEVKFLTDPAPRPSFSVPPLMSRIIDLDSAEPLEVLRSEVAHPLRTALAIVEQARE